MDNTSAPNRRGSGQSHGHSSSGGHIRRQRSLEWRQERDYDSSSDEEVIPARPVDSQVFATLLAQAQQEYQGIDRSYRSDSTDADAVTTDNPTTPFPTPPPTALGGGGISPRSPPQQLLSQQQQLTQQQLQHRQASPFPLETTNSRRVLYGTTAQERLRGTNGEIIYAPSNITINNVNSSQQISNQQQQSVNAGHHKKTGSSNSSNQLHPGNSTLGRSGHGHGHSHGGRSRHHRAGAAGGMTSSSSATSCNSCADMIVVSGGGDDVLHVMNQSGRGMGAGATSNSDMNGDSPPEPAPPEVPPRGPSLHSATLRRCQEYNLPVGDCNVQQDPATQFAPEFVLSGSPRNSGYPSGRSYIPSTGNSQTHRLGGTLPLNTQQAASGQTIISNQSTLTNNGGAYAQQQAMPPQQGPQQIVNSMPGFPLRQQVVQQQQQQQQQQHMISGGGNGVGVGVGAPPHYSPYSPSRFHIDKRCQHRCTWKCLAIGLILVSVVLTGMLAYFAAVTSMKPNMDSSNCILVQDVKDVTPDQMTQGSVSTQLPTEESLPTSTAEQSSATTQHISLQQPQQQSQSQPQPPLLELREFDTLHTATIPPYHFWNSELRNKQPAFIRFNFTLPWGANFAVYGRRNVAPSVTQYDFVEFVKGGRVDHRLRKRETSESSLGRRFPYSNSNFHRSDVLDSISSSYEGTRKILADADARGPFYVPHSIKLELYNQTQTNQTDLPHPTISLQDDLYLNAEEGHIISKRDTSDNNQQHQQQLDISMLVNVSLLQYLDTGRWFLSVYNDELQPHIVSLVVSEAEGISTTCPNDCSGRGSCYLGKCDCIDGFQGIDCSKSICPVLCSNHGQYGGGLCHCEEGWKGPECDTPENECRVPDCSGRGQCVRGGCRCRAGWKGDGCEEADCEDPTCSEHGACVQGQCYCKAGWQGERCHNIDEQVHKCLPSCSDHGAYDLETGRCICNRFWTGADCSQALCNLDCGANGRCDLGKCRCNPGWTGSRCELLPCDPRCQEHGQCRNGTCVCSQGWNGRHCTLPGCENGCSGHGQCNMDEGLYKCVCIEGWAGTDCSIPLEISCNDDVDNDQDGMIDCSDSECCAHSSCTDHIMCLSSNDPVEVLLRKQPPSVTASFYQRVKFLIEENSVQSYAHMDEYTESEFWNSFTPRRVAVMRGQVVTPQGIGIIGIRVSVDRESRFGFTLTRQGGWFDVLVNGGGAITLQFQRSPFRPLTMTVFVPWNQIVVLPPVHMQLNDDNDESSATLHSSFLTRNPAITFPGVSRTLFTTTGGLPAACLDHDPELLNAIVTSTWLPEAVGGLAGQSAIFAETQIVQESIPIPGSDLHLMYQSSQATGYLSTVHMRLTGNKIPATLTHVHVRVEVEGSLHVKTYEADPNLKHTFAWNKRNVYKQKVYGVAQAKVSVGYEHSTCSTPIWQTQTANLKGFDVDISDIGGWSLDIHHHYNFHEGILQKGDGSTLHLKQYPRTVNVVMGTGLQRTLDYPGQCGGPAKDAKLLTPVSLASGPDGSIYVGDFNLVRRITPEGNVYTVLQVRATQVAYQYYLTVSPADGHLYVSDPEKHQILKVISLDPVTDPSVNSEPVVGNGERCIPGDDAHCGDEAPAKHARLAHPKGIAISSDRTMYIADGTNIRAVDPNGIIHTLVGSHGHHNHWAPIPCRGAVPAVQAQLQWPTGLALSPLDGALHLIDDRLVLKLTADMKIKVVAGIPLHCRATDGVATSNSTLGGLNNSGKIAHTEDVLGTVLALAFSPNGDLYIAESDTRKWNFVRLVDSSGQIQQFAGRTVERYNRNNCDCSNQNTTTTSSPINMHNIGGPQHHNQQDYSSSSSQAPPTTSTCSCSQTQSTSSTTSSSGDVTTSNAETLLSSNARFQAISALTVSPAGVLHVADQGSLHILALDHYLPAHDENGEFHIPYPAANEIYVFNRYGQHVSTKDLTSGKTRYSFLYSKNTSFGKLSTVTDSSGNKIQFLRDYSNAVSSIENTQDHKSELKISGVGYLVKLSEKGRSEIEFDYDMNTGLLTSRSGGGETFIYQYDWLGRANGVILPSGETIRLKSELSQNEGLVITVDESSTQLMVSGNSDKRVFIKSGDEITESLTLLNSTVIVNTAAGGRLDVSAVERHPLLEAALPVEAEMLPIWSEQNTKFGEDIENHMSTKFSLVGDARNQQQILNREIFVNGSKILDIEFDQSSSKETIYDRDHQPILAITYDSAGLPLSYVPAHGADRLNISYDGFNRIDGWKWGSSELKYSYDRHGLLSEITSSLDGTKIFSYNELNMVSKITLASQRHFALTYSSDGRLLSVTLPSGTKHQFTLQPSLGFLRATYTPPGSQKAYLQHYTHCGRLLQTVQPGDGARVVYRYHGGDGRLKEVVHGDGKTVYKYGENSGMPSGVEHVENDVEYRWDYQYTGALLLEERLDFGAKTGLSNAKFTYDYDSNYRLIGVQGRIGGQNLPPHILTYNSRTGTPEQIASFRVKRPTPNETVVSDGTGTFGRIVDGRFLEVNVGLTIHGIEVFRMEFGHDVHGRISQTRTYTRNVGVNTYTNLKNYTWDCDGQLLGVEAQEPWGFRYDDNGNMLSLTYRGNTIPMEYNAMDRIIKFGEGQYRYDNRGLVTQNAREERFHYNAKALLVRATKRGRFDVRYYYDHMDRLATRKDNFGNVTQFFYNNQQRLHEVSQIYSPRDGKLMSLIYDDRGHLIYAQVYRHKYYIATDQCGTPIMIFNQYGEGIREIMRSPYGHIVYDSNPYLYLPVDFCGGLLDQVTSLVHMSNGKIYDPLIGQWMSPLWEDVLERVSSPTHLHLYRLNGNDPINSGADKDRPTDHLDWMHRMGFDLKSLAPQLYPNSLPGGQMPPILSQASNIWSPIRETLRSQLSSNQISTSIHSGFLAHIQSRRMTDAQHLSNPTKSALKTDVMDLVPKKIGAASDPPFGKGILVSRTSQGRAIVSSVPAANAIYRDVYTSVFNRSFMLPFTFVVHSAQQDAFYFVKEDTWKANDDKGQLKRLQGQVNTTFHELAKENGSGNNYFDVKIHGVNAVVNLRYGTTLDKEKQRLLHHAKLSAIRKAWHKEKEALKNGFAGTIEWISGEVEEIMKSGYASNYEGEYIHDVQQYPELAEDPYNVRFQKKQTEPSRKRRKKRDVSTSSATKTAKSIRWWCNWKLTELC